MSSPLELIIDTQQGARVSRGQRKLMRLPKPPIDLFPVGIERDFRSEILRFFDLTEQIVREELLPQLVQLANAAALPRTDARLDVDWARQLNRIFGGIEQRRALAQAGFNDPKQFADDAARELARGNLRAVRRQVKSVLGLDIFINDTRLNDLLTSFSDEATKDIRNVPDNFVRRLNQITIRGLRQGARASTLEADIRKALGDESDKARKRAALIARDQLGSLRADITKDRQTQLGVKRYKWRTVGDERVRSEHAARQGTIFKWSDPPPGGHPGQPILCRCTPEPVIDDLL